MAKKSKVERIRWQSKADFDSSKAGLPEWKIGRFSSSIKGIIQYQEDKIKAKQELADAQAAIAKILADKSPIIGNDLRSNDDQNNENDRLLSSAQLADYLSIAKKDHHKRDALRKHLESWRKANPSGDGWIEVEGAGGRKAKYLYNLSKIRHLIEDMKTSG
jgi:hypothetical protein